MVVKGAAEYRARGIPIPGELVGCLVCVCSAENLAEVERVLRHQVDALVAKWQNVVLIRELRLDRRQGLHLLMATALVQGTWVCARASGRCKSLSTRPAHGLRLCARIHPVHASALCARIRPVHAAPQVGGCWRARA